jgi:hypothetical protein
VVSSGRAWKSLSRHRLAMRCASGIITPRSMRWWSRAASCLRSSWILWLQRHRVVPAERRLQLGRTSSAAFPSSSDPLAPLPELPDAPNGLIAEPLPKLVRELAAPYDLQATTRRLAQAKKPLIRDKSRQHIKAG